MCSRWWSLLSWSLSLSLSGRRAREDPDDKLVVFPVKRLEDVRGGARPRQQREGEGRKELVRVGDADTVAHIRLEHL